MAATSAESVLRPQVSVLVRDAQSSVKAVDDAVSDWSKGINWHSDADRLLHCVNEISAAMSQERGERFAKPEWLRAHRVHVNAGKIEPDPQTLGLDNVNALKVYVGQGSDVPLVVQCIRDLRACTAVEVVAMVGLCSLEVLRAVIECFGNTVRVMDMSICVGITPLALHACVCLPQLHHLMLLTDLPVSSSTGSDKVMGVYEPARRVKEFVTLVNVLRAATACTLVHLQLFGVPKGDSSSQSTVMTALHELMQDLPYLQTFAAYFLPREPERLPTWWRGQCLTRFQAPRFVAWRNTVGFEAVCTKRPLNGPVVPRSKDQLIVPV